jgi:hypothetical protein
MLGLQCNNCKGPKERERFNNLFILCCLKMYYMRKRVIWE